MKPVVKQSYSFNIMLKFFVLLSLITFASMPAFTLEKGDLEKGILDILTDREGAVVYINGEREGMTDPDGLFHIALPQGRYHLFIEQKIRGSVYSYQGLRQIVIRPGQRLGLKMALKKKLNPIWKMDFERILANNRKNPPQISELNHLKMIAIPAGEFMMGSNEVMFAKPAHRVKVPAFKIAQNEMTFALYDRFVQQTGYDIPEDDWGRGRQPLTDVSWYDAKVFLQWLNSVTAPEKPYRLPTEAEWEYAARAGTQSSYWWGEGNARNRANCSDCGNPWYRRTVPAGTFAANPFGLNDTSGNVYEWVQDCWNSHYERAPQDGSAWLNGYCKYRVIRGGCWYFNQKDIRSASRTWNTPTKRDSTIGFRVAQDN